jgi:hypothetical protein
MNRQQRRFQERQEKILNKQSSINNAFNFLDVGQTPPVLDDPNSGFTKPSFFTWKTYSEIMSQMKGVNNQ